MANQDDKRIAADILIAVLQAKELAAAGKTSAEKAKDIAEAFKTILQAVENPKQ